MASVSTHSHTLTAKTTAGVLVMSLVFTACNLPRREPDPTANPTFSAMLTSVNLERSPTPVLNTQTRPPGVVTPGAGTITATPTSDTTTVSPAQPATGLPAQTMAPPPAPLFTATPWVNPPQGRIVYTCYVNQWDQICLMNADGSGSIQLTDVESTNFYASLAPDGSYIVYTSRQDGPFQIYRIQPDGSGQQRLTEGLGNLYAPAVSPDGTRIVFTVESGGRMSVWIMNSDGSDPHELEQGQPNGIDPTWAPDGSRVAFTSKRGGSNQIYTARPDGTDLRQITREDNSKGGRISWSPDGEWIAFYAGERGRHEVFITSISTGEEYQLTNSGDNLAPAWSPDGQWLAFTTFRTGNNDVFIMRPDGTQATRVTGGSRPDWQPRWGR